MRVTVLYIFLMFSCLGAYAQKDVKAGEIMDKSSKAYAEAGSIFASFTLNIKDVKAKVTHSFDGKIQMKDNKFYFSTPETDCWFDGKTQWSYIKMNDEVNITEPSKEESQMMNPSVVFDLYKKGCKYKYTGTKKDVKDRTVYEIELTPNKKNDMQKIVLQINTADYMPVTIHVYYKGDIQNIVYINTYKTKQNLPDSNFVFDKKNFPEAEIIDLR